ncbi:unnamed protein product [Protopolystoma xenopodis]|uniref:VWF/SSPO/Zonadhesin-like cysteine-rich domain-containing protein n=1 Tax=Protopolystoma xenopodis TaxID=117903 RepID=A0A448WXP7_9PLAT|nr:unnamed protein product [Protopolystoma xenopodis]
MITGLCISSNPERRDWAAASCALLLSPSGPFQSCVQALGPEADRYHDDCIYDACGCDQGGDCQCLCTAIAAMAQACANIGHVVRWRSQSLCRECSGSPGLPVRS